MIGELRDKLWAVLLFLMCALPVNLQVVKAFIMLTVIFFGIIDHNNSSINIKVVEIICIWIFYAIYTFLNGFIRGNIGALSFVKVNFFYYLLFGIAVCMMTHKESFLYSIKAMYFANWFISFYTIYLLLFSLGIKIGSDSLIILDDTSAVGLHAGYTHITNTNLSMTIVTFPMVLLSFKALVSKCFIEKVPLLLNVYITALSMILSGRRILWIVLTVSFVLFIFCGGFEKKEKIKLVWLMCIVGIFSLILVGCFYKISFAGLFNRFFDVFRKNTAYGENVRYIQMKRLIEGFFGSPILGKGAGAVLNDYQRSSSCPWVFETSYHMVLFNSGIIGVSFYILSFIFFFISLYNCKSEYRNPVIISFCFALFANATNPYIAASFDFWFFYFVPLLFVNCDENLYQKGNCNVC